MIIGHEIRSMINKMSAFEAHPSPTKPQTQDALANWCGDQSAGLYISCN